MPPIRKVGTLFVDLEARSKKFDEAMLKAGGSAKNLAAVIRAHPIAAAAALGAAFALVGAKAVKMASELENAFGEISTLVNTAEVDVGQLKKEMLELFAAMPVDELQDMSRGLYQIISASIPAAQSIDFLRVATEAAVAGLTSVEVSVDGLTTVVNAWARDNITATEVADQMFTAVRFGKTTFDEIATSVGRVAGLAATMGISFKDVLANATALTLGGVDMELAMRSIRQTLANVIRPTSALKTQFPEIAKTFNRTKLEADGLTKFMVDLAEALKDNEDAAVLMFQDVNALNAALQLTGQDGKRVIRLMGEMERSTGAAGTAFAKMEGTTKNLTKQLKNQFGVVMISLGESILPTVNKSLQVMVNLMSLLNGEVSRLRFDNINNELQFMTKNFDLLSEGKRTGAVNEAIGRSTNFAQTRLEFLRSISEIARQGSKDVFDLNDVLKNLENSAIKGQGLFDPGGALSGTIARSPGLKLLPFGIGERFQRAPGQNILNEIPTEQLLALEAALAKLAQTGELTEDQIPRVAEILKELALAIGDERPEVEVEVKIKPLGDQARIDFGRILLGLPTDSDIQRTVKAWEEFTTTAGIKLRRNIAENLGDFQGLRDIAEESLTNEMNAAIAEAQAKFDAGEDGVGEGFMEEIEKLFEDRRISLKIRWAEEDAANLARITKDINTQIARNIGDFEGLRDIAFASIRTELEEAFKKLPPEMQKFLEPMIAAAEDAELFKNQREDADKLFQLQRDLAASTKTLTDDMELDIEGLAETFRRDFGEDMPDDALELLERMREMLEIQHIIEALGESFEGMGEKVEAALLRLQFGSADLAIELLPVLEAMLVKAQANLEAADETVDNYDELKTIVNDIVTLIGKLGTGIATAGEEVGDTTSDLEKQRRLLQANARQIESMVRGALQLAEAFELVSEAVSDMVQGFAQAFANAGDLALLLEKARDDAGNLTGGLTGSFTQILGAALPVLGGFAQALSGLEGLLSGGPSPEEIARLALLRQNNDALDKLSREIGGLGVLGNVPASRISAVREAAAAGRVEDLGPGTVDHLRALREAAERYDQTLRRLGLSTAEVREVANGLNIHFRDGMLPTMEELALVVRAIDFEEFTQFAETVQGQMDRLQLEFDLLDVDNPIDQLRALQEVINSETDLVFGGSRDDFDFGVLEGLGDLDFDTESGREAAEAMIREIVAGLRDGSISLDDLGDLSLDQLIAIMRQVEGALDEFEADGGGQDLEKTQGFNAIARITESQAGILIDLGVSQLLRLTQIKELLEVPPLPGFLPPMEPPRLPPSPGPDGGIDIENMTVIVEGSNLTGEEIGIAVADGFVERLAEETDVRIGHRLATEERTQGNTRRTR